MALTNADRCHVCAHPLASAQCPHPWNKPFEEWPAHLLGEVKSKLKPDPDARS